jgi:hypothetical protein
MQLPPAYAGGIFSMPWNESHWRGGGGGGCLYELSITDIQWLSMYYLLRISLICAFRIFFSLPNGVRRRPGYKIWRLFKFSSILLSFKTRHWLFILIYINFGKFKLEKAPNFVTRPASNVDRRTPFGSEKKMRNAHISEMRSNSLEK